MVDDRIRAPELLARRGGEGMKVAVDRGDEDLALPDRHATIDEVAAGIARRARVGPRVELPKLLPRRRIKGVDVTPGPRRVLIST